MLAVDSEHKAEMARLEEKGNDRTGDDNDDLQTLWLERSNDKRAAMPLPVPIEAEALDITPVMRVITVHAREGDIVRIRWLLESGKARWQRVTCPKGG